MPSAAICFTRGARGGCPADQVCETRGRPTRPHGADGAIAGRGLVFTWIDAPGAYTTGIFMGTTSDFIPTLKTLVYCVPTKPAPLRQGTVNIAPGVYYVVARSGQRMGALGRRVGLWGRWRWEDGIHRCTQMKHR